MTLLEELDQMRTRQEILNVELSVYTWREGSVWYTRRLLELDCIADRIRTIEKQIDETLEIANE